VAIPSGRVEWHIEKSLVDALPDSGGRLKVHMGDYGCWTIGVRP
jgi:hypothetical protein